MITYVYAQDDKKFVLTEFGFEKSYVRCRYISGSEQKVRYEKKVPVTWVEKEYVRLTERRVAGEG